MMGIQKEVRKFFGSNILAYICSMRTAQGYEQWGSSTQEERSDIINRWHERKSELQSVRQKILEEGPDGQEIGRLSPKGFLQTRHLSFEERKRLHEERRTRREKEKKSRTYGDQGARCPFCQKTSPHPHSDHVRLPQEDKEALGISGKVSAKFGLGIRPSVAAASEGNLEEGLAIGLLDSSGSSNEQEATDRAVQAADMARQNSSGSITEDDEDFQLAIKLSKAAYEENELKNKMEEDIVIEYIQKQSLAEGEYRMSMQDRQKGISSDAVVDGDSKSAIGERRS
jgi:hypothetical protein